MVIKIHFFLIFKDRNQSFIKINNENKPIFPVFPYQNNWENKNNGNLEQGYIFNFTLQYASIKDMPKSIKIQFNENEELFDIKINQNNFILNPYNMKGIVFDLSNEQLINSNLLNEYYDNIFHLAKTKIKSIKFTLKYNETYSNIIQNFYHFLVNIQPNGRFLSPLELLVYASDLIKWLFTLQYNDNIISAFASYATTIFWKSKIFGATSILLNLIKIDFNPKMPFLFLFPIDLEVENDEYNYEFFHNNFKLIDDNIVNCDNILALIYGYQISLHSKFIQLAETWVDEDEIIDTSLFSNAYYNRIILTLKNHPEYNNSFFDLLISKFNDFISIIIIKSKNIEIIEKLKTHEKFNAFQIFVDPLLQKIQNTV